MPKAGHVERRFPPMTAEFEYDNSRNSRNNRIREICEQPVKKPPTVSPCTVPPVPPERNRAPRQLIWHVHQASSSQTSSSRPRTFVAVRAILGEIQPPSSRLRVNRLLGSGVPTLIVVNG